MNKNKLQINKGFTVIELVISIFILSIAIIGAYNAFTTMDILTSSSTDRFVAAYLAQEGVEIIRNIRDTNWLEMAGDPAVTWTTGLADGDVDCTDGCEADYTTFGNTADPLYYPYAGRYLYINDGGFYVYETEGATKTKFKRKITLTLLPTYTASGVDVYDTLKVVVEVSWDEKGNLINIGTGETEDSIVVEEYLYNWY